MFIVLVIIIFVIINIPQEDVSEQKVHTKVTFLCIKCHDINIEMELTSLQFFGNVYSRNCFTDGIRNPINFALIVEIHTTTSGTQNAVCLFQITCKLLSFTLEDS